MKTALFVTDCSVDSAIFLRNWLVDQAHHSLRLTVVHPYAIAPGQALNKTNVQPAKEEAHTSLKNWSTLLGEPYANWLKLETLFASAEQTLRMHRLMRQYDYWINEVERVDRPLESLICCS